MGLEFVTRIVKTTAIVSALTALFVATYFSPAWGGGVLLGATWNSLNLLLVAWLVRAVVAAERAVRGRIVALAAVKFPVLYGLGFLLLRSAVFPVGSLVTGFSLVLVVILLKALGAATVERMRQKPERTLA
ncbi:MAG: hypothetical protein JSW03_10580 [Candidatus Eiseniibacteriota bacterium]|nr:MAG: hypothetical protein JSW03_10580 [Candidatus Eisenbacteria bacterium]